METGGDLESCVYLSTAELISLAGTHFSLELQSFSNSWSSFFRRCSHVLFLCGTGGLFLYMFSRRKRKTYFISRIVQAGQALVDFLRGEELVEDIGYDNFNVYPRYFGPSRFRGSGYEADLESDSYEFHLGTKCCDVSRKKRFSFNQRVLRRSININSLNHVKLKSSSSERDERVGRVVVSPNGAQNSTDETDVVEIITVLPPEFPVRGVPDGESFSEEDQATTTPSIVGKTESQTMHDMVSQAKEVRKLIKQISLGSQESDFSLELYSSDFYPSIDQDFKTENQNLNLSNYNKIQNHDVEICHKSEESSPNQFRTVKGDNSHDLFSLDDPWEWDNEGLEDNIQDEVYLDETTLDENTHCLRRNVVSESSVTLNHRLPPLGQSTSFST